MIENAIVWPNGARCAVAFTFDMDGESLLHIYQGDTAPNRVALSSMLRYGPEIAIPRNSVLVAIEREHMDDMVIPTGDTQLQPGDRIVAVVKNGAGEKLQALFADGKRR